MNMQKLAKPNVFFLCRKGAPGSAMRLDRAPTEAELARTPHRGAEAPADEAGFIAAARTADAIYAKGIPITKSIIDALENCKVITLGSVGVDSVDDLANHEFTVLVGTVTVAFFYEWLMIGRWGPEAVAMA